MKTTKIFTLSATALLSLSLGASTAFAVDGGVYDSNGQIKFTPNTDPTNPVDPTNPTNPITPVDPTDPSGPNPGTNGPLSIDYASSFDFGEQQITSVTKTYQAVAQKYKDKDDAEQEGPNFVQVTDNRGLESGWTLTVKQDAQFKSTSGKVLTGAKITLKNGTVVTASDSAKPTGYTPIALTTDGSEAKVMSATDKQGAGTYLLSWGTNATTGATSVDLEVPGATTKYAEIYKTTLTWSLTDVPGN